MKFINVKTIIVLVVLIILVVGFDLYLVNTKNGNTKPDNNKTTTTVNSKLKELAYKDYLVTYILMGDVKTSEGYIEMDGITYYVVDDELFKDINSIDDITNIIEDTFDEPHAVYFMNYLHDENYNNYLVSNNHLYIKKGSNLCKNLLPYNESIMRIENGNGNDGDKHIVIDEAIVRASKLNNKWYAEALEFCID